MGYRCVKKVLGSIFYCLFEYVKRFICYIVDHFQLKDAIWNEGYYYQMKKYFCNSPHKVTTKVYVVIHKGVNMRGLHGLENYNPLGQIDFRS